MRMMFSFATIALGISALAFPLLAQSAPGAVEIHGVVKLKDGAPLTSALITAKPVYKDGQPAMGASVLTGKDGAFRLTGLSGGAYRICIFSPKDHVLDPCEWSETPPEVDVPPGAIVPAFELTAAQGVALKIRADDFAGAAPGQEAQRKNTPFQPTVRSANGKLHKLRMVSSDSSGSDYELVVPPDAEVQLVMEAYNLQVFDPAGATIDRQRPLRITTDRETLAKPLRYQLRPIENVKGPDESGRENK